MKKQSTGNPNTATNFFVSQFKLKANNKVKYQRQAKYKHSLSAFHHQILSQQLNKTKQTKTNFINHNQLFKETITSRQSGLKSIFSKSKEKRTSSLIGTITDQPLKYGTNKNVKKSDKSSNQHHQKSDRTKEESHNQNRMPSRKLSTSMQIKKEKLQKSAFETYQNLISKENEENQNIVDPQNAQALYLLLKKNRNQPKTKLSTNRVGFQQKNKQVNQEKEKQIKPNLPPRANKDKKPIQNQQKVKQKTYDVQAEKLEDLKIQRNSHQYKNSKTQKSQMTLVYKPQAKVTTIDTIKQQKKIQQKLKPQSNLQNKNSNAKQETSNVAIQAPPKLTLAPRQNTNISEDDEQLQQVQIQKKKMTKQLQKQAVTNDKNQRKMHQHIANTNQQKDTQAKKNQKTETERQQFNDNDQSQADALDDLYYYLDRIQDIGQYHMRSKDLYADKSISQQLLNVFKICDYYMAHQFCFMTKNTLQFLKGESFSKGYYNISEEQLIQLQKNGSIQQQLQKIQNNLNQGKKLLKKCYEACKNILKKQEQILIMEAKINYHIKSCAFIIKQFKIIYSLHCKMPQNQQLVKRSVFLIQIFCVLQTLNNNQIKDYQQFDQIQNPVAHIAKYKNMLLNQQDR